MSLSDQTINGLRRATFLGLAFCALTLMAGCGGWRPLYAAGPQGLSAADDLAQITIRSPKNRLDQLIRNNLISLLGAESASPRYKLEYVPVVTTDKVLIQRNTDAQRVQYRLNVNYKLIDISTGQQITAGHSFSVVSYNRVVSEFANVYAERDAREKTARAVSEDIRTRLAGFFAGRA